MADVASPSGAAMFDGGAVDKKRVEKPEKPDEEVYKSNLAKAEKAHQAAQTKFNEAKKKVDIAQPKKDGPAAKRRGELLDQLKSIREQQAGGKAGRNKIFDDIKRTDEKLKSLMAEQKVARSRTPFKSVEDVDRQISSLEKQVEGGMMKLVDEKKALAEISSLRKQRKGFAGLDEAQKTIDETKKKLVSLRSTLDDPESKALSDKYSKIQEELDAIKAEQDEAYKSINTLRDEKTKLHNEQQEKWEALQKVKDEYYQGKKAFQNYEFQARKIQRERRAAEQEAFEKGKKKERAQKMLDEASDKAYLDEIRRAESLLRFLDPSYKKENAPLQSPSQFGATAQRTIDDAGIKGMKVVRKEDKEEDYFMGTGGKKGKKGKKAPAATTPAAGKYNCPPSVMEDCAFMGIEPPMMASDVPAVREKVQAKLAHWKEDQEAQTEKNIAKAKKEVERLDAEESGTATPVTATNGHGHGETKATASVDEGGSVRNEVELLKEAAADVVADLKGASLEDKE